MSVISTIGGGGIWPQQQNKQPPEETGETKTNGSTEIGSETPKSTGTGDSGGGEGAVTAQADQPGNVSTSSQVVPGSATGESIILARSQAAANADAESLARKIAEAAMERSRHESVIGTMREIVGSWVEPARDVRIGHSDRGDADGVGAPAPVHLNPAETIARRGA